MSVPIRLVQRNGKLIHLDASKVGMSFKRSIAAVPMPVLGERYAADMNIVAAEIQIDCILRDDDCESTNVAETAASAFIDFARPNVDAVGAGTYFNGDGGDVTIGQSDAVYADITDKEFKIKSTYMQANGMPPVKIKFISTGTLGAATYANTGNEATVSISLNHANLKSATPSPSSGSYRSIAQEVATYLTNALNHAGDIFSGASYQITSTGGDGLGDAFTATLSAGAYEATLGNTRVDIVQKETGVNGNTVTPVFWDMSNSGSANTMAVTPPSFQTFRGGQGSSCKSAGDKVQDLIANVSNSNVMGSVGEALAIDTNDERKSFDTDFNGLDPTTGATQDYIVGIQIPYNSLIQAAGTTSMVARNFLIVTGLTPADAQGAEANSLGADTTFDSQNVYTGIRGTVTTFNFRYDAGNTFYDAKLTFQPLDLIGGL